MSEIVDFQKEVISRLEFLEREVVRIKKQMGMDEPADPDMQKRVEELRGLVKQEIVGLVQMVKDAQKKSDNEIDEMPLDWKM